MFRQGSKRVRPFDLGVLLVFGKPGEMNPGVSSKSCLNVRELDTESSKIEGTASSGVTNQEF